MARTCKNCVNEGRALGTDDYCTCLYGRQLKAKHEQAAKQARKEIEDTKAVEIATKKQGRKKASVKQNFAISEGDWIMHGDLYGVVNGIKGEKAHIIISHGYDKTNGKRVNILNKHFEAHAGQYVPADLETFDNADEMLIDLALQTKDRVWFDWLTRNIEA